jgi:hypothetical protein
MREIRQTQVRVCDADPSDNPRDSRSRRFYLWPGEEIGRVCKGPDTIHKPHLMAVSVRWNMALLLRRYG